MSKEDREWNTPLRQPSTKQFDRWYDANAGPGDDFTFGEWVWKEARKDLLREQRQRRKKSN